MATSSPRRPFLLIKLRTATALNLLGPRSYLRILAEVDNAAEEVEETLEALE